MTKTLQPTKQYLLDHDWEEEDRRLELLGPSWLQPLQPGSLIRHSPSSSSRAIVRGWAPAPSAL